MTEVVLCEIHNGYAEIILNRPQAMNAYNKEMSDKLLSIAESVADDKSIRAVVLKGSGNLFMAGGDIKFFYDNLSSMPKGVKEIIAALNKTIIIFMSMPKPLLASVHGSVAGVGVSLMAACDLVVAVKDTKFTTAYSGLGISPDGGASYNLPHMVGAKKAMEWLMLAELFTAETAHQHGLVNWVVEQKDLEPFVKNLITRLVNGPTTSLARIKKLVNQSLCNDINKHLEMEGDYFAECTQTADFKAGVTSFLQKSKPIFTGE